jgi:hypothetical protein
MAIFHNIPRDAETVAAVRNGCTERGFATTCAERARRCRGAGRADEEDDDLVLPRCLAVRCDILYDSIARAEVELMALRLIVAEARGVPDPDYVAEFADFDEAAVADAADDAPWER